MARTNNNNNQEAMSVAQLTKLATELEVLEEQQRITKAKISKVMTQVRKIKWKKGEHFSGETQAHTWRVTHRIVVLDKFFFRGNHLRGVQDMKGVITGVDGDWIQFKVKNPITGMDEDGHFRRKHLLLNLEWAKELYD